MKLIINVIVSFLVSLIQTILGPINTIILNNLPGLDDMLSSVRSFFTWLVTFIQWVMSWLPFNSTFISYLIVVLIFRLTIPLLVDIVKLVVKWWHALAP